MGPSSPSPHGSPTRLVTVTPAGRQRYLEILATYLLRNRHVIDEHHWWVNTRAPHDIAYLLKLVDQYPDFFKIVTRPARRADTVGNSIWRFMRQSDDPQTIYVRLDDDICYMSHDAIAAMRDARLKHPGPFLILGNIVNNAICSYFGQQAGLYSKAWGLAEQDCMDPVGWNSGPFVVRLHRWFQKQIARGTVDRLRQIPFPFDGVRRFSVNAICWFGADMAQVTEDCDAVIDEEPFLTVDLPQRFNRPNLICPDAIFGHYAFYSQRNYVERLAPDILIRYQQIASSADALKSYYLPFPTQMNVGVRLVAGHARYAAKQTVIKAKQLLRPKKTEQRAA